MAVRVAPECWYKLIGVLSVIDYTSCSEYLVLQNRRDRNEWSSISPYGRVSTNSVHGYVRCTCRTDSIDAEFG